MKQKIIDAKKYTKCCAHCLYGTTTADGENVLCVKKGVMLPDSKCRKYVYDPIKRVPCKTPPVEQFESEDFAL